MCIFEQYQPFVGEVNAQDRLKIRFICAVLQECPRVRVSFKRPGVVLPNRPFRQVMEGWSRAPEAGGLLIATVQALL